MALRAVVAALVLLNTAWSAAQGDPETRRRFDVASIRVVDDPSGRTARVTIGPDTLRATNQSLAALLVRAYSLPLIRVVGLPEWESAVYFDIDARAGSEVLPQEIALMLRELLRERLGLRARVETRAQPIYALVVDGPDDAPGPGLRRSVADCAEFRARLAQWDRSYIGPRPRNVECESRTERQQNTVRMTFPSLSMARFAAMIESWVERAVVDRTGLTGDFDINIEIGMDDLPLYRLQRPPGATPFEGPSVFTALEAQLGLRLKSERGPVDVLVIESVNRVPTEDQP